MQSLRDLGVNISEEQADKILKRWEWCCDPHKSVYSLFPIFSFFSFFNVTSLLMWLDSEELLLAPSNNYMQQLGDSGTKFLSYLWKSHGTLKHIFLDVT